MYMYKLGLAVRERRHNLTVVVHTKHQLFIKTSQSNVIADFHQLAICGIATTHLLLQIAINQLLLNSLFVKFVR